MIRGTRNTLTLLFAIAILAGACGSGTGSEAGGETLAEFFGHDDPEFQKEQEERWRADEIEMQEKIAECMRAEGFEYTAFVHEEMFGFGPDEDEDLTEDERKLKYGYGHFVDMLDEPERMEEFESEEMDDPNWAYMESLPESERMAYEKALMGDWEGQEFEPEFDEEGNEIWEEPDWSVIGGCENMVREDFWGGQEELWEELGPKFDEMWDRVENDPRIVEIRSKWSSCMAEKGYDFESEEDIYEHLEGMMDDLHSWEPPPDWEPTEEEIADFGPWGPGIDEAQIQELADEELAIAAADVECSPGMQELIEEVHREIEALFIEENRELLVKVRDAERGG